MARIIETTTDPIATWSTSTSSPSTWSRTRCATPATRWTRCCSARPCRPGIREQHDEFPLIADPDGKMVVGQFGAVDPRLPRQLRRRPSRRATSCSRRTRTPAVRRSATPTTGWSSCRSSSTAGIVGWASMFGHMSDVGGKTPAPCPPTPDHLRGGRVIPPFKLYKKGVLAEEALRDHPQPGPQARLEPGRPERDRRRLPHGRAPDPGDVRAVRHRHLPVGAGRAAPAQLQRHEDAAGASCSRTARPSRSPTTSATTASGSARTS